MSQQAKRYLLFDLGETLIAYLSREQFRAALPVAFEAMHSTLMPELPGEKDEYWAAMRAEAYNNADGSVRRLEDRLGRIFGVTQAAIERYHLCDLFMAPILQASSLFDDTVPTLRELSKRYTLALVSNTPWGSPKRYFERDLGRHGISGYFAHTVFCRDVGYRKPHAAIFEHTLALLDATPGEAVMVGDRYDWDIEGAHGCGIDAVLLDRDSTNARECPTITTLSELSGLGL